MQNAEGLSFTSLHEKDRNQKLLRSFLYISNAEGKTKSANQLEFFEELKPIVENCQQDEIHFSDHNNLTDSILRHYTANKQNASLSMRSKIKAGKKEQSEALRKMKSLYKIEEMSEDIYAKIEDICDSINDMNHTVIRKVLETDFTEREELGTMGLESDIHALHSLTQAKDDETTAEIAIQLVGE